MRKIIFLSLFFSAFAFFSSCTKEKTYPPVGNPQPQEQPPTVIYSEWTEESSLSWSDTVFSANLYLSTVWDVPALTQSVIDNGAILIYARTNSDATVRIFPAMTVNQNNNDFEQYQNSSTVNSFDLLHSKVTNGVFEMPSVNNNISLRYVLLENAPPANARIATGSAAGFNMEDLRSMNYQDVAILLGIPD